ncbi:MAG TPA: hypothetical protein VNP90_04345 [Actinomycetota bacterium]|nr:hypothetical protein [Actinomycetota bacterium]
MLTEEELVETALLRYAQQRATRWGAHRFAAEFHRRDLEERWLVASRSGTTPYTAPDDATSAQTGLSGPVEAGAQENVVGSDRNEARMVRPAYARHSSVPRPPTPEPEPKGRRSRHRAPKGRSNELAWLISPAEAARMSPAGRRLYGLDDPSDRPREPQGMRTRTD